jgi:hypothetical protein
MATTTEVNPIPKREKAKDRMNPTEFKAYVSTWENKLQITALF